MFSSRIKSLIDLQNEFRTEQDCIEYLEKMRWNGEVVSPFDPSSKVYKCKNNLYRCKNTGKYFNAKTNLIFHKTSLPLIKWYMAIWLVMTHKKGISSVQVGKDIGVTQKTAWFILQRIRLSLGYINLQEDEKLDGAIEVDETFIGGKNKNRHKDKKVAQCQGRSFKDKVPVFGMLQRGGKVIAKIVPNTQAKTLSMMIHKYVKKESILYTDEWDYGTSTSHNYDKQSVDHSKHFYGCGDLTTNHIEGFWALIKRSITGIYYHWSKKHMQKYIDECVFRFNTRKYSDNERFELFLQNIQNRITYKQLIYD